MENNVVVIPKNFGAVPDYLRDDDPNDMAAGIGGGFGIISYRGKAWRTKFRGEETVLMREDGDGPRNSMQVVVLKAPPHLSKIFFENGYTEGNNSPPDCFSTNGIVPDPAANKKQARACAGCPKNAWGSRVSEAGQQLKACSDSKRLAVVPAQDVRNADMGGPMLLRVPAASLQDMALFTDQMKAAGYNYNTFVMDISFDVEQAYPKFVFKALRPLTPEEREICKELADGPITQRILSEPVEAVSADTAVPAQAAEKLPQAAQLFAPAPAPVQTGQTTAKAAAPVTSKVTAAWPKFDPETGEKIIYPDEVVKDTRPKFDPETGEKIIYDDTKPAAAKPVAAKPVAAKPVVPKQETAPEKSNGAAVVEATPLAGFDDALANLLGNDIK